MKLENGSRVSNYKSAQKKLKPIVYLTLILNMEEKSKLPNKSVCIAQKALCDVKCELLVPKSDFENFEPTSSNLSER